MADRIKELSCMCGAREPDKGQPRPRKCWDCKKETMGAFPRPTKGEGNAD